MRATSSWEGPLAANRLFLSLMARFAALYFGR